MNSVISTHCSQIWITSFWFLSVGWTLGDRSWTAGLVNSNAESLVRRPQAVLLVITDFIKSASAALPLHLTHQFTLSHIITVPFLITTRMTPSILSARWAEAEKRLLLLHQSSTWRTADVFHHRNMKHEQERAEAVQRGKNVGISVHVSSGSSLTFM